MDLPREILCKIFENSSNLKSLLLVNKSMNDLITQSVCLMKLLTLKLVKKDPNERLLMNTFVKSNRQYQHLKVVGKETLVIIV